MQEVGVQNPRQALKLGTAMWIAVVLTSVFNCHPRHLAWVGDVVLERQGTVI